MDQLFVQPASEGLLVRDPVTFAPLPAEGAFVPRTTYWLRRLRSEDVVEATPPEPEGEE